MEQVIQTAYRTGIDYNKVHHFRTDSQMVMLSDGRKLSDAFEGEKKDKQNLAILKNSGKYLVTNSVGLPNGLEPRSTYLLIVESLGNVVWQTLYDHTGGNIFTRVMTELGFSNWSNGGKDMSEKVDAISKKVANADFDSKSMKETLNSHDKKINDIVKTMGEDVVNHNHDERYVRKIGGMFTGNVGVTQGSAFIGTGSGNGNYAIGKVDSANQVVLGSSSAPTIVESSREVVVKDNRGTHTIIHTGNIKEIFGQGSGSSQGQGGSQVEGGGSIALRDDSNTFTRMNTFKDTVKFESQAKFSKGIVFEGYSGQRASLEIDGSDLVFNTPTGYEAFRIRSKDNAIMAKQKLILEGDNDGNVWFRMGVSRNDVGCGFKSMPRSNAFVFFDWASNRTFFSANRSENMIEFTEGVRIGGVGVYTRTPSSPKVGDILLG